MEHEIYDDFDQKVKYIGIQTITENLLKSLFKKFIDYINNDLF